MNQDNATTDLLNEDEHNEPKAPSGLKTLTVLTFIGCGIGLLFIACARPLYNFSLGLIDKALESNKDFSPKELADMHKAKDAIELALQNLLPIMIIGLAGIILCFVGALWMRKLKKEGFWIYVAGELAPIIATAAIMGTSQYNGIMSIVIGLAVPVIFVVLYATQRKYLVK